MPEENKTKTQPEKSIIALEIYKRRVKLCEAAFYRRRNPVYRLLTAEIPEETADISAFLTDFFASHNIITRRVILNIPRLLVMARVFRLPSVNDEEIKSMVKMEAVKQMPYRDEELITGYRVVEKQKDGYSNLFLAICQAKTVNHLVNILRNAGLVPDKIALGSEALFVWNFHRREKSARNVKGNVALISIDHDYVDMDIIEKGNLVFARAFSYDYVQEDHHARIAEEIIKSVTIYQKDHFLKLESLIISGASLRVNASLPTIKEALGIPIEVLDQTEGIELAENADNALQENSFVELIGLVQKKDEIRINLLPEKIRDNKELLVFKKAVTRTLTLFALVIILFLGIIAQKLFDKRALLNYFNAHILAIEGQVTHAKKMRGDLKMIKSLMQNKSLAIDILAEVYKITPGGITFNMMDYENKRGILLRGNATSLDGIIRFISILEGSDHFEEVKLKYTTKRRARGKEMTDFEIMCEMSKITR